jgi:hypothetical protein
MPATSPAARRPDRTAHRLTCVAAGGLALLGGALGLFVNPWLLILAIAGGVWLIASGLWGGSAEPATPTSLPPPVDPVI